MSEFNDYRNSVKVPILEDRVMEMYDALSAILDLAREYDGEYTSYYMSEIMRIAEEVYFSE